MRKVFGAITLAVALGIGAWTIGAGAAQAAPGNGPNAETIHADCGSAGPMDVVINFAAGQFAAAHVVGGGTFVPLSFGEQTVTFTPPGGTPQTQTFPGITKGQSSNASGDTVTCSFDFTASQKGATVHVVGTVTGVIHGPQG